MCDHMQQTLHIKPEDLRIYDLNNDELPELLDDEEKTIEELDIKDGQSILIESKPLVTISNIQWNLYDQDTLK